MQTTNPANPDEIEERLTMNGAVPESAKMTAESTIKREEEKVEREADDEDSLIEVERTIAFTDAAVAIAMTLLILPLMEQSGADEKIEGTVEKWYEDHAVAIFAFIVSFSITAQLWKSHNALFSRLEHMSFLLVSLNFLWMMAVTFIPVSTSLIYHLTRDGPEGGEAAEEGGGRFLEEMEGSPEEGDTEGSSGGDIDRVVFLQYFVNLLIVRVLHFCMVLEARSNPSLWNQRRGPKRHILLDCVLEILLLSLACGLSQTWLEMYSALVIAFKYPIMWLLEKKYPDLKGRFGDHRS